MALSQRHDSSPGRDDIPYDLLRHMSDSASTFLLDLYNLIRGTDDYLSLWSVAVIFPIPKNRLPAENYRPISVVPFICTFMEKMVNVKLMLHLGSRNLLTPVLYGY